MASDIQNYYDDNYIRIYINKNKVETKKYDNKIELIGTVVDIYDTGNHSQPFKGIINYYIIENKGDRNLCQAYVEIDKPSKEIKLGETIKINGSFLINDNQNNNESIKEFYSKKTNFERQQSFNNNPVTLDISKNRFGNQNDLFSFFKRHKISEPNDINILSSVNDKENIIFDWFSKKYEDIIKKKGVGLVILDISDIIVNIQNKDKKSNTRINNLFKKHLSFFPLSMEIMTINTSKNVEKNLEYIPNISTETTIKDNIVSNTNCLVTNNYLYSNNFSKILFFEGSLRSDENKSKMISTSYYGFISKIWAKKEIANKLVLSHELGHYLSKIILDSSSEKEIDFNNENFADAFSIINIFNDTKDLSSIEAHINARNIFLLNTPFDFKGNYIPIHYPGRAGLLALEAVKSKLLKQDNVTVEESILMALDITKKLENKKNSYEDNLFKIEERIQLLSNSITNETKIWRSFSKEKIKEILEVFLNYYSKEEKESLGSVYFIYEDAYRSLKNDNVLDIKSNKKDIEEYYNRKTQSFKDHISYLKQNKMSNYIETFIHEEYNNELLYNYECENVYKILSEKYLKTIAKNKYEIIFNNKKEKLNIKTIGFITSENQEKVNKFTRLSLEDKIISISNDFFELSTKINSEKNIKDINLILKTIKRKMEIVLFKKEDVDVLSKHYKFLNFKEKYNKYFNNNLYEEIDSINNLVDSDIIKNIARKLEYTLRMNNIFFEKIKENIELFEQYTLHQKWLKGEKDGKRMILKDGKVKLFSEGNYNGAIFENCEFCEQYFYGINFNYTLFIKCNLSIKNIIDCSFEKTSFLECDFILTKIKGLDLNNDILFKDSNIYISILENINLEKIKTENCNIVNPKYIKCQNNNIQNNNKLHNENDFAIKYPGKQEGKAYINSEPAFVLKLKDKNKNLYLYSRLLNKNNLDLNYIKKIMVNYDVELIEPNYNYFKHLKEFKESYSNDMPYFDSYVELDKIENSNNFTSK
jgi:uncharacterized protein YjbI with pentapeptide repeats